MVVAFVPSDDADRHSHMLFSLPVAFWPWGFDLLRHQLFATHSTDTFPPSFSHQPSLSPPSPTPDSRQGAGSQIVAVLEVAVLVPGSKCCETRYCRSQAAIAYKLSTSAASCSVWEGCIGVCRPGASTKRAHHVWGRRQTCLSHDADTKRRLVLERKCLVLDMRRHDAGR